MYNLQSIHFKASNLAFRKYCTRCIAWSDLEKRGARSRKHFRSFIRQKQLSSVHYTSAQHLNMVWYI